MQILTANHWTEAEDPYGSIKGRTEEAEGDCNPTGRPTVSTSLDAWKLLETELPAKEHAQTSERPWHLLSRGLPCLASVGKDELNPIET